MRRQDGTSLTHNVVQRTQDQAQWDQDHPLFGLSAEKIAAETGIPIASVYRYKRNPKVPPIVEKLVSFAVHGRIPSNHRSWKGWTVQGDALLSPEGESFTTGQIRAAHLYREVSKDAQRQLAVMREELANLRGALAQAAAALDAANAAMEQMTKAGPIRVQLVAIDADGNQTALTAPVAPIVRVTVPAADPWHPTAIAV